MLMHFIVFVCAESDIQPKLICTVLLLLLSSVGCFLSDALCSFAMFMIIQTFLSDAVEISSFSKNFI